MKFPQLVNFQEMTQVYSMPIKGGCQLYACINGDIDNVDLIDELEDFSIAQKEYLEVPETMDEFLGSWMHSLLDAEPDKEK